MPNPKDWLPDDQLNRSQIMDKYWLEFLRWYQKMDNTAWSIGEHHFWLWYIDNKLMEAN